MDYVYTMILKMEKRYNYLHSTIAGCGIFVMITKQSEAATFDNPAK